MEAIVLAGGFGTRLSHIVSDVPKPMAPIKGHPFLKFLFESLLKNGITHVVLAVGFKADIISDSFGNHYKELKITYSKETIPLGTGGAIKLALRHCTSDDVFIINGDTYFDVNLRDMYKNHISNNSKLTLATKEMLDFDRYGSVIIKDNKIIEFREKHPTIRGIINGGIYLIKKDLLELISEDKFSFESRVLENLDRGFDVIAYESKGYFIDIGVPEDYYKAQEELIIH